MANGNPAQALGGDGRAVAVIYFLELAAAMRPTEGQRQGPVGAGAPGQPVVASIAVGLQDTIEAFQELLGMFAPTPIGVKVDYTGRIFAAPGSVVPGQRPEIAGLRLALARGQNRGGGFIHEQLGRGLQMFGHSIHDRRQVERRLADPAGQRGTIDLQARTAQHLSLAVERRMIGVFADQHMGNGPLGRQPTLDQVGRRFGLADPTLAGRAGVFGAHRHDDPQLGGDDVEPFRAILADPLHLATAAGAGSVVRLDDRLDPGQVLGQIAKIASGLVGLFARRVILQLGLMFLGLGHRHFEVFKAKLAFVRGELFRLLAIKRVAQFPDQMFQPRIGLVDRFELCLQGFDRCPDIGRKSFKINGFQRL